MRGHLVKPKLNRRRGLDGVLRQLALLLPAEAERQQPHDESDVGR